MVDSISTSMTATKKKPAVKAITLREFVSNYLLRLLAIFLQFSFAAIAGGAIVDVVWWKSMLMAGIMGIATVGKFVFKNMAQTGKITRKDLDAALALAADDVENSGING